MSDGYVPKNSQTAGQSLKVQELDVSGADADLFSSSGGNTFVNIRESVSKVYMAQVKIDASNSIVNYPLASTSIVDSSTHSTSNSDSGAIQITGLASLATNDLIIVKYSVQE